MLNRRDIIIKKYIAIISLLFISILSLVACENEAPDFTTFNAKILEIHKEYYLVEPVEGSQELNTTDRIEVPIKNIESS